jgi:hypothetical protein
VQVDLEHEGEDDERPRMSVPCSKQGLLQFDSSSPSADSPWAFRVTTASTVRPPYAMVGTVSKVPPATGGPDAKKS